MPKQRGDDTVCAKKIRGIVWSLQAEAQFHTRKITDDTTKYHNVVAALDQGTSPTSTLSLLLTQHNSRKPAPEHLSHIPFAVLKEESHVFSEL